MTEREYVAKCEGFKLKEGKAWEHTRMILMFQYNSMSTKPIADPKQLFRIPVIDGEEGKVNIKDIRAFFKKHTPK